MQQYKDAIGTIRENQLSDYASWSGKPANYRCPVLQVYLRNV
ncbi:MAG: hypothetical protein ACOYJG_06550 [Prevotella sp.]